MTTTGLNSDLYYSDNPIYITFSNINIKTRYIEYFPFGIDIKPIRLYVNNQNSITTDISQLVKLCFPDVAHNTDYTTLTPFTVLNNWVKLTFNIKEVHRNGLQVPSESLTRTFVKGGRRTYQPNQNVPTKSFLTLTDPMPQWGGYPVDFYFFNTAKQMQKSNVLPSNKEVRKIKGCDPLYLKFKNLKGGYSYWLFENWENEQGNKGLGIIERPYTLTDLGNETDFGLTAISKVPKRFFPIIEDLIFSLEVYMYLGNNKWEQITSDNNKTTQNLFNENEKVKLKFKRHHRLNPSLLWSN